MMDLFEKNPVYKDVKEEESTLSLSSNINYSLW